MGTRHLIVVKNEEDYVVAQYGQWDGYPEGQGKDVLEFLKSVDLSIFKKKLSLCRFGEQKDWDIVNKDCNWTTNYPHLSRDAGAKILNMIMDSDGLVLKNSLGFAGDSLFCEYAYLIDLDENKLEFYKGFVKQPLDDTQRFSKVEGLEKTDGYFPIKMVAKYDLDNLPSVETLKEFDKDEEDDED